MTASLSVQIMRW